MTHAARNQTVRPRRLAVGGTSLERGSNSVKLGRDLARIDKIRPIRGWRNWPRFEHRTIGVFTTLPKARPWPVLRAGDQSRSHRIAFDVPADPQKVAVTLDRKGFESALVERPDAFGLTISVPTLAVGHLEPLHEFHELSISGRPDHEMEMVRHDAIGEKTNRRALLPLLEGLHERAIRGRILKDRESTHAAVQHVKQDACRFMEPSLGHEEAAIQFSCQSRSRRGFRKLFPASFYFTASATRPAFAPEPVAVTISWRPARVRYVIGVAEGGRESVRCQSS